MKKKIFGQFWTVFGSAYKQTTKSREEDSSATAGALCIDACPRLSYLEIFC